MPDPRQRVFGFPDDQPPANAALPNPVDEPDSQQSDSQQSDSLMTDVCIEPVASPQPESLAGKTIYVVDANSLIYQVFHAIPEMTSPTGQPVAAVYGFVRDMLDILEKKKPDYLFCAFDGPTEKTFRHELFKSYKSTRKEMPIDLRPQIGNIKRMLAAMSIPSLVCESYEADDILATIARRTETLGGTCVIVTGDKDCRQLISDQICVYNIRKDEMFDAAALQREWGVSPSQVVDFQALVGDTVDAIPGVPLIGPKIAAELLQKYGTLDSVFEHVDDIAGAKRKENLRNYREQALVSRKLVRLDDDMPIQIDWVAGETGKMDARALLALCTEFGFRRLPERITALAPQIQTTVQTTEFEAVTQLSDLKKLVATLGEQRRIAFDVITNDESPRWAEVVGIAVSFQANQGYYIPLQAPQGEACIPREQVLTHLKPIFEDPSIEKVGHNCKYDLIVLRTLGVQLRGIRFDTMVADYLLEPGERIHALDDVAKRHLRQSGVKSEDVLGTGKSRRRLAELPVAAVTALAGQAAQMPLQLVELLESQLEESDLIPLFSELEIPLVEVLAEMEFNGIRVDVDRLGELGKRFGDRMKTLEAEIFEISGGPFNIESPKQLSKLLFEQLQLPVLKRTKTGPSTDAAVLSDLAKVHPLPAKIIEYRQNAKLKSTYVDALPTLVHPLTGRVHTSFKQDVAATGRLSSTDPNLQNIPIRNEQGREIRSAFLPAEPGWSLLAADYSQIELRVLAHYSGDEALQRAFQEDRDIHTQVAAEVYGVSLDEVTRDMRRSAKTVNFGVIYGQSPFGLSKALDIDQAEAERFIKTYFGRYSGVAQFMTNTLKECRRRGFVSTILGRRRPVQGVRDPGLHSDSYQRTMPERIAINTVIQGSAADIIKRAMINVHRRLEKEKARTKLLLQIHDELLLEVPSEEVDSMQSIIVEEMTSAAQLSVPLKVDVKLGANWAECE